MSIFLTKPLAGKVALAFISVHFLPRLKEVTPKTKRSLFGIGKFIKQLKKEGKLDCIVIDKITPKDIVTDKVGVPNDVLV